MKSLDCLRLCGTIVSFGQSSGPVAPIDVCVLAVNGSLFLTRPTLSDICATRAERLAAATALFALVARGAVRAHICAEYPLRDAAKAHDALGRRRTSGSLVLRP